MACRQFGLVAIVTITGRDAIKCHKDEARADSNARFLKRQSRAVGRAGAGRPT
jgi:hypothetical protein